MTHCYNWKISNQTKDAFYHGYVKCFVLINIIEAKLYSLGAYLNHFIIFYKRLYMTRKLYEIIITIFGHVINQIKIRIKNSCIKLILVREEIILNISKNKNKV